MKSYSEYKKSDSKLTNKIPKNWAEVSLKRAVDGCVNGIWGNEPDGKNDIACIRVADFDRASNSISTEKLTFRSVSYSERANRLVKNGDLLIEKSGGGEKTLVGAVAIFQHDFDAVTSNFVAKMSPNRGYSPTFLNYCFSALYSSNINYCSIKQTTGIQNLDSEAYLQEKVGVPSYSEQQKIAQFLDYETAKIDALIDEQKRLIELLKEKRQAVISHAVTKGLNPDAAMKDSGVEWLGEVPEHWEVTKLGYLGNAIIGLTYSPDDIIDEGGTIVLRSTNIQNGHVSLHDNVHVSKKINEKLRLRIGDILICSRNGSRALIGKNAVIGESAVGLTFGAFTTVFRSEYNPFLKYIFDSRIFSAQAGLFMTTTVNQLTTGTLNQMQIALPPVSEQSKIIEYLDSEVKRVEVLTAECKSSLTFLQERRSALISAAVTGKIDVRDWQPPAGSDTVDSNASMQTERHYG